jgi:TRAP-type C4-dicarboxylate transport system substrate-binding protein
MRRRDLLGAAGAVVVSGAIGGHRAAAQDKKVLKASDVHPEGYPTVQAVENMSKKLEQATNGRLSIQMYASMQLGGEKEVIEQAQVGAIQFARVSVGTLGPVVDDLNVLNLPFVFRDVGSHAESRRRRDRAAIARQGHGQPECEAGRAVLDGCRRAQLLRHEASDQEHRRSEGA